MAESPCTYLCVSQAGCGRDGLLHRLCFPSHTLAAMVLWLVSGRLCPPVLAQQQADDVCVSLQSGVHQRTLTILISAPHLGTEGAKQGPLTIPIKQSHPTVRSVCRRFPRKDPKSATGLCKDPPALASDWLLCLHMIGHHSLPLYTKPNLKFWVCNNLKF